MELDLSARPTRHSYSSISTYLDCPAAYAYAYILRRPEPPSAAMMRGTRLHSLAEKYMLDQTRTTPVPYELKRIGVELHKMRERQALPEAVWLVDQHWEPTDDQSVARVKAIVDVHYLVNDDVLKLRDYKSGRQYPSHTTQLELYSILGLLKYPSAKRVESDAVYIDQGVSGAEGSMLREMLPYYIKRWDGYLVRMEADRTFEPNPGTNCKRCSHSRYNGGPCTAASK